MNDHLDLDVELDLERAAARFDVSHGDVDRVIGRARQRRRRHQRLTGAMAVVAVVAGTALAVRASDGPQGTEVATEGESAAQLGDAGINWERHDAQHPLSMSWSSNTVNDGDALYAVSTAPGEAVPNKPVRRVIWRSDDGIDWTLGSTPGDVYVSDLATGAGQLYAVGTGPATAAVVGGRAVHGAVVGWSVDGEEWDSASLPIDFDAIVGKARAVSVSPQDVAAGPGGVVAVVTVAAEVNVRGLLPDGVEMPNGWALTPTGIDVLGDGDPCPEGDESMEKASPPEDDGRVYIVACTDGEGGGDEMQAYAPSEARGVTAHYDWSELGVEGDLRRAVLREPIVFHAPLGSERFERVHAPVTSGLFGGTVLVQADGDGFDLVASSIDDIVRVNGEGSATLTALRSTDGRTWVGSGAPLSGISWISAIGRVDGHLALIGGDMNGTPRFARLAAGGWQVTSLRDVVGPEAFIAGAAIGPLGVVAAFVDTRDEVIERAESEAGSGEGDPKQTWRLLASRDGVTWSTEDVGALTGGDPVQVLRVTIDGDRAIVAVAFRKKAGDRHMPQAVLIGTPR